MRSSLFFIFIFTAFAFSQLINMNPDPEGEPWWAGGWRMPDADEAAVIDSYPKLTLPEKYKKSVKELPYKLNNTDLKYFRPIFNQKGGSCAQATGVGYVFTYEMNFLNGTDASFEANQFPTHYTYNFLNGGSGGNGSMYFSGWDIINAGGIPDVPAYGGMWPSEDLSTLDKIWMNGFEKYTGGAGRRIVDVMTIPVGTPEGLETLKQFMNDYCDGSETGGIASFAAGVSYTFTQSVLPIGTENEGQRIIIRWDKNVNHAMTFIGYNDSIRWDFNTDGRFSNYDTEGNLLPMSEWEVGGLLMANSWGDGWANGGKAWVAYRTLARSLEDGGIWNNAVHTVRIRDDFEPTLYLKTTIDFSERNELAVYAGIASDTTAASPERTLKFPHFNHQGGAYGMQGVNNVLEFGLDISPLLSYTNPGEASKFFLCVSQKPEGETNGRGKIVSFSIADGNGNEFASPDTDIEIARNSVSYAAVIHTADFDPPVVNDTFLPRAQAGEFYSHTLTASNGKEPYRWDIVFEYAEEENTGSFPDISSSILEMSDDDDGYAVIDLDFQFPFYGELHSSVTVITDGSIMFGGGFEYVRSEGDIMAYKTITPYGADLMAYPENGDAVYYEKDETSLTVRWVTSKWNEPEIELDFACRIHADSRIEFFYGSGLTTGLNWAAGVSNGRVTDAVISSISNIEDPSGRKTAFSTGDFPYGIAIDRNGTLSGATQSDEMIWGINFRVTDDRNISSFRTLDFSTSTGIETGGERNLTGNISLFQNYPNPFNPETSIRFSLKEKDALTLTIYNVNGSVADVIFKNREFGPGFHLYDLNMNNRIASGTYFLGLRSVSGTEVMRKMSVIK